MRWRNGIEEVPMGRRRWWLRRTERRAAGEVVSLEQPDGTVKTFPTEAFNLALFCAAAEAAAGVVPEGPVPDAVRNATPQDRQRLERAAASGELGDFLRGNGEGGLLEVADVVDDLSEGA
jgi:hypothetical protein